MAQLVLTARSLESGHPGPGRSREGLQRSRGRDLTGVSSRKHDKGRGGGSPSGGSV